MKAGGDKVVGWGERTKGCSANFIMVTQDSNETRLNHRKPKSQMGTWPGGCKNSTSL